MTTEAPKYFLLCNNRLVLSDADEDGVHEKISDIMTEQAKSEVANPADEKIDTKSFQLLQGRVVPMTVETGVRVKLTKRVHKAKGNGKKKAATVRSNPPVLSDPSSPATS